MRIYCEGPIATVAYLFVHVYLLRPYQSTCVRKAKHLSRNGSLHKMKRFGVRAILIQLANYIHPRLMNHEAQRDPAERRERELH